MINSKEHGIETSKATRIQFRDKPSITSLKIEANRDNPFTTCNPR